mgnify:CR=1 FL=1
MQTSVTFKNLDSSENLKSYVGDKLDRFDNIYITRQKQMLSFRLKSSAIWLKST